MAGLTRSELFSPSDIVWIKNVTNKEHGHAYIGAPEEFVLHFPDKFGESKNLLGPKVGEIILVCQNINGVKCFTHLVTPLDSLPVDEKKRDGYRYGRLVRIIAMTGLDSSIPVRTTQWNKVKFGSISHGNACRISKIESAQDDLDILRLDAWNRFAELFVQSAMLSKAVTNAVLGELQIVDPTLTVLEGKSRMVTHMVRERNPEIVEAKKAEAKHNNALVCEVCSFSFSVTYGCEFIECHHRIPISETGERETKLEDLALVCSNCHRMLHKRFDGMYLTIPNLQKRLPPGVYANNR